MGIAVGQTSKGRTSSATSQASAAVNTAATGSDFVAAVIYDDQNSNFSSIADNMGNSANYVLITGAQVPFATNNLAARFYHVANGAGGTGHTFTATVSPAAAITVLFLEITGGLTSGILDQSGGREDTASPYTLAAGLTTQQAAELLVSLLAGNSGSNPATHAESGLGTSTVQTAAEELNGATFLSGALATSIKAATGTFNPSWTETGASATAVMLATFKEAAAGSAVNRIFFPMGMDGTGGGRVGGNRIH